MILDFPPFDRGFLEVIATRPDLDNPEPRNSYIDSWRRLWCWPGEGEEEEKKKSNEEYLLSEYAITIVKVLYYFLRCSLAAPLAGVGRTITTTHNKHTIHTTQDKPDKPPAIAHPVLCCRPSPLPTTQHTQHTQHTIAFYCHPPPHPLPSSPTNSGSSATC